MIIISVELFYIDYSQLASMSTSDRTILTYKNATGALKDSESIYYY